MSNGETTSSRGVLLDILHQLYFAECSGCAGLAYQHSKGCLRFRQNILTDPAFAARVGVTPEQVQMARDKGLLPEASETTGGSAPTAAASGAAASASTSTGSGTARAVSGIADVLVEQGSGTTSGSVPGTASGPVPGVTIKWVNSRRSKRHHQKKGREA
eukprot:1146280-Amphidinium_carterae.1